MAIVLNRYPLWKYLALIAIILCGLLYAAPNLFGDRPVIEIAGTDNAVVDAAAIARIEQVLVKNAVAYQALDVNNAKLTVRLKQFDDQLKAKEQVQTALGEHYTVTVNLVPATPIWLTALGASPMKLGLDLRGGVHFLLQVDVASAVQKRMQSDLRAIEDSLQEQNIHYAGVTQPKSVKPSLKFRNSAARLAAQNLLQQKFNDYIFEPTDASPDYFLSLALTPTAFKELRTYTMSQTIQVLKNRINALGVAESIVTWQGAERVSIDLPGVQDTTQASQILGGNATLEMRLVNDAADLSRAEQGDIPLGSSLYHMSNGAPIVLKNQIVLSGDAITKATAGFDEKGQAAVNIRANGLQIPQFHQITGENVGKRMAIILVDVKNTPLKVAGKLVNHTQKIQSVISAPVINSALGSAFQVTGLGSIQNASNLAIQLRSGTTPANLYTLQELLVGPSLGKTNINYGLLSVAVGFFAIVIFMIFYYRLLGLIADLALALNLILIVALMSIVGFTLSLPGMAAIVLTVGMAVDANVLIFERIREELRNGVSPQAAIHAGYERAFSTIIDANLTTLIVALVLFMIATSTIKAFAITLIIGLLTSMLTAIMGTRAVVNLIYGGRNITKLSIGI